MAKGKSFAHNTLYRALNQPLLFFDLCWQICKTVDGLHRGHLLIDDVLIQRYRSGRLGLQHLRDTATGA